MPIIKQDVICDYCRAKKGGPVGFIIGAKPRDMDWGWTMVEGTGKIACALCYPKAREEGRQAIRRVTGI